MKMQSETEIKLLMAKQKGSLYITRCKISSFL